MSEKRADLTNWRKAPFSYWAFRNVEKFIKTEPIEANPSNSQELSSSPISLDSFKVTSHDGTTLTLNEYLQGTSTDSFIVLKDGVIVYEHYDHGNTASSKHILMSVTKSVIGLLLGILIDQGKMDEDAVISKYVPEVANNGYHDATIRQLIDMRTGVQAEMWDPAYRAAMGWEPRGEDGDAKPNGLLDYFAKLNVETKPHGDAFKYVSQNTDLLGLAMERAAGKSLPVLLSELFWKPLGAQSDALMTVDQQGASRAAGGICSTLRDFARIGQLLVDDGRVGSTQIVPKFWIEDLLKNGDPEAWKRGDFAAAMARVGREINYRSGWYISRGTPELISAIGLHGQQLFVDRADRLVIAKTSAQVDSIDPKFLTLQYAVVEEIRRITNQK